MSKTTINIVVIGIVIFVLLLATGNLPFLYRDTDDYPTLGELMETRYYFFAGRSDDEVVTLRDRIDEIDYNADGDYTEVYMKSYRRNPILFEGRLDITHNSRIYLEGTTIIYNVTVMNYKGYHYLHEFFTPKPDGGNIA